MKTLIVLFIFWSSALAGQPALQKQAMILRATIQKNHISPVAINDSFSTRVFDNMLAKIDKDKIYFTRQDIEKLSVWRLKIDDEITGKSWGFVTTLTAAYRQSILRADSLVQKILQQPFSFNKATFFNRKNELSYAENNSVSSARWTDFLRNNLLENIYDALDTDSIEPSKSSFEKQEPVERKMIAADFKESTNEILQDLKGFESELETLYLNAIATSFDPHTAFFPAEEKKEFEESLSDQQMKYGFALQQVDNGELAVASLIPGSPAWNSSSIHVNDKVLSFKDANGKTILVKDATRSQLDAAFENPKLELTVQSADGKTSVVPLRKELIANEDNIVKGYILEQTSKKIGFIALPSFYTSWNDNNGSSCANDIAKEIVKLKKDGIEALILDLRYNGGGSVQEALELAGIFIDAGPLVLVKEKSGKTSVLKDPARGTIFDGPLGIIINGQSASASELVAGTLQDYHRAVIIGNNSFGKATMQAVLPMDSLLNPEKMTGNEKINEENGFAKITLGKLYRINGKTNQLNGVLPDIILPTVYDGPDYTERSMPFALPADTVMKNVTYTLLKALPLTQLAAASKQRMDTSVYFHQTKKIITNITSAVEMVPQQWEPYVQWRRQQEKNAELMYDLPDFLMKISSPNFDNKLYELDAHQQEISLQTKKQISKDAYIKEAAMIMADLIRLQ